MCEDNINDEVIKIFIESWLIKYENFHLEDDSIQRSFNGYEIIFRSNGRQLELFAIVDNRVLEGVQIVDMDASKCISFAIESYLHFHKAISEIKKNH